MSNFLSNTSKYLSVACAAPRLVIGLILLLCVPGWLYVWHLPDIFQSEARVYYDFKAPYEPYPGTTSHLEDLLYVALTSTTHLERVAFENDLLVGVLNDQDKRIVLEDLKENVNFIFQYVQDTHPSAMEITISYRDSEARRSMNVVRSFLDLFFEMTLADELNARPNSLAYLEGEIESYRSRYRYAEAELGRFSSENPTYDRERSESGAKWPFFPELEDEFRKLNRNYIGLRDRYEDFLERHKLAEIAFNEVRRKWIPSITVLEPPRTLPSPVFPNRLFLFVAIFFGACALGITAPNFLHLIKSSGS